MGETASVLAGAAAHAAENPMASLYPKYDIGDLLIGVVSFAVVELIFINHEL